MPVDRTKAAEPAKSSVGFRDVLRVRAFAILYGAEVQSIIGDQLARVALSVLIFAWTGSAWVTAVTYGLTFFPAVFGGFALSRVGDRFSRRTVMIVCELIRAAAFATMAIPGMPFVAVAVLLVVAVLVGPAFTASAVSYLSVRLTPAQFRTASGLRTASNQAAQVVGFAIGGALVAAIGTHGTLLLDAVTYLVSAAAVIAGVRGAVRTEEAPATSGASTPVRVGRPTPQGRKRLGPVGVLRMVMADTMARTMFLLSLLAGLFVVPESLAIPFASEIHATTSEAGLLLASIPLGSTVGVLLLVRLVPEARRHDVALAMAVLTGVPLIFTVLVHHVALAGLCWVLSGLAAAYQIDAFVTVIHAVPDAARAQLVGVFGSLLLTAQGAGPLIFGLLASAAASAVSVTVAGATGVGLACVVVAPAVRSRISRRIVMRPVPDVVSG